MIPYLVLLNPNIPLSTGLRMIEEATEKRKQILDEAFSRIEKLPPSAQGEAINALCRLMSIL